MNNLRSTTYSVRVNGETVQLFGTLREARQFIKTYAYTNAASDAPKLIEVVKTVETVVGSYIPRQVTTVTFVSTGEVEEDSIDTGIQEA